jgi:uridylate kinase
VFGLEAPGNVTKALEGEDMGTLVCGGDSITR